MRLEQFINEGRFTEIYFETDNRESKINKMAQMLFKNCKPYLKDLKKTREVMYRGARGGDMTEIIPRKNRDPKDMPIDLHNELDDAFNSEYGWKARSEGVFCSGDYQQAKAYGDRVFTVWPIGKYKFLWSWSINDLFTKMENIGDEDIDTDYFYEQWEEDYGEGTDGTWYYGDDDTKENDKDEAENIVLGWLEENASEDDEDYDPQDDLDDNAFEWHPDVDVDSYVEDMIYQERERLEDEKTEVVYDYQDKDILAAIRSSNEIMVSCDSYYIIANEFTDGLTAIVSKGKIKPVHKQLKFQFAYRKRRPRK